MINRIQIQNFKSIQQMDLNLNRINVLIGSNGVGKSNFISFFRLLKNMYDQNLQNYIADEEGIDNVFHHGIKNSLFLNGRIEFDKINAYKFELQPTQEGNLYFSYEGTQYYRNWGLGFDSVKLGSGYQESILKDKQWGRYTFVKDYLKYLKIFHFHDTSKTASIKRPSNVNDNSFLREDAGNLAAYLFLLQEVHPKNFKKIELAIKSVAPFFERFDLKTDRRNPDLIRLEWIEKGSNKYFNAMHLSDGTLRFMALATLLLQPVAPSVIIIDEPELGLHPSAITKLAALIKKASAQTQIIISTQSVNLLDHFEPEDIITVDRIDNQSVFKRQSSEALKEWMEDYSMSDLWSKNVIGGRP
ncbi:MAG: AAA family ATPase [Flavobacterium sp.]|nr:AAA family ATPase [Flavobacterium sp.]